MAGRPIRLYVANVIAEGLVEGEMPATAEPIRPSDEGILILYGDAETGVTVVVAATDADDAERRILATFSDSAYVDCIDLSVDQRPLAINLVAGTVPDEAVARELLRLDAESGGLTANPDTKEVPSVTTQDRDEIRRRRDAAARERLAADGDPIIPKRKDSTVARSTTSTPRKSRSRKSSPATTPAPEAPVDLTAALMTEVRETVDGIERIDAKSGSYFRLRLGKATLGYVNESKKGLTLDLATPAAKVPKGVETKPGPNASLPVKYKVESEQDAKTAARLVALAIPAEEAAAAS